MATDAAAIFSELNAEKNNETKRACIPAPGRQDQNFIRLNRASGFFMTEKKQPVVQIDAGFCRTSGSPGDPFSWLFIERKNRFYNRRFLLQVINWTYKQ